MNTLIDRYLHQVREHLPEHVRDDVARELQSVILDTLDDRARGHGVTDALVVEVLTEFGEPSRVAARYHPEAETPLHSEWIPVAWRYARRVALIVALALAGVWVVMVAVALLVHPGGWRELMNARQLREWLVPYAVTLIINLGVLVGLFALFGRLLLARSQPAPFDPRTLPPLPSLATTGAERIGRGWALAGVLVSLCALTLMNVLPQWFGLPSSSAGEEGLRFQVIPFAALGLHVPLGIVNLWWLVALGLSATLLLRPRWTRALALAAIGLELVGAGVFFYVALTSDPASATPPLGTLGRMAVAAIVGNGVFLLACGVGGVCTMMKPGHTRASMKLA